MNKWLDCLLSIYIWLFYVSFLCEVLGYFALLKYFVLFAVKNFWHKLCAVGFLSGRYYRSHWWVLSNSLKGQFVSVMKQLMMMSVAGHWWYSCMFIVCLLWKLHTKIFHILLLNRGMSWWLGTLFRWWNAHRLNLWGNYLPAFLYFICLYIP